MKMFFILIHQRAAVMHVVFPALCTHATPSDALSEGDTFKLSGSYLAWKNHSGELPSGEGRMMIDSVVWAQYINVTDTQTATSP